MAAISARVRLLASRESGVGGRISATSIRSAENAPVTIATSGAITAASSRSQPARQIPVPSHLYMASLYHKTGTKA